MIIRQKTSHRCMGCKPYIKVGTLVKHLGGLLGNQETKHHIKKCHHNPHPIIIPTNNLNNGTLQVGITGHPSTLLLLILLSTNIGHRDGGDKHIPSHHLSSHLVILILSTYPIPNKFFMCCTSSSPYCTTISSFPK